MISRSAVLAGILCFHLLAQPTLPVFEAATVRAAPEDDRTWALRQVDPVRYRSLSNVMQLITWSWQVRNYQVVGAPD